MPWLLVSPPTASTQLYWPSSVYPTYSSCQVTTLTSSVTTTWAGGDGIYNWTDSSESTGSLVLTPHLQEWSRQRMLERAQPIVGAPAIHDSNRARRRSQNLFFSMLNEGQREEFKRAGCVTLKTPSGKLVRIQRGVIANVERLDPRSGAIRERLCCHVRDPGLPVFDHMLAQLLHLRDPELEQEFFRIANRHPLAEEPRMQ